MGDYANIKRRVKIMNRKIAWFSLLLIFTALAIGFSSAGTCNDSDNSMWSGQTDYNGRQWKLGSLSGYNVSGQVYENGTLSFLDFCYRNTLYEGYCDVKNVGRMHVYDCPYGCLTAHACLHLQPNQSYVQKMMEDTIQVFLVQ